MEFPGWAGLQGLGRATANIPAGTDLLTDSSFEGLQKEHLTLDVHRNLPPPLFKALNRLEGGSQELRHLLLGLLQFLPQRMKFFVVHGPHSFKGTVSRDREKFQLTSYTTTCYLDNIHYFKPPKIYDRRGRLRDASLFLPREGPRARKKIFLLPFDLSGVERPYSGVPPRPLKSLESSRWTLDEGSIISV